MELNASLCEELDRILSIYVQYIVCIYIQAAQDCGTQRLIPWGAGQNTRGFRWEQTGRLTHTREKTIFKTIFHTKNFTACLDFRELECCSTVLILNLTFKHIFPIIYIRAFLKRPSRISHFRWIKTYYADHLSPPLNYDEGLNNNPSSFPFKPLSTLLTIG